MSLFASTKNTRTIINNSFRYIRSDVPNHLSAEERQWLIDNNVKTVIDLRESAEQEVKPCSLKDDDEFDYISMAVTGGNAIPGLVEEVALSYINMVDETMEKIIDTIMNAKTNVMYFCNAGKDRTGVVTAIILCRIGYDNKYIIDDYLLSGENLKNELRSFADNDPEIDINIITPKAGYMEKFLNWYKGTVI